MDIERQLERQNLANRFTRPQAIANACAGGFGVLGVWLLFQPSTLARSLSLASLLTSGGTVGISRLSHKHYIDLAFQNIEHERTVARDDVQRQAGEIAQLKAQLAQQHSQLTAASQTERQLRSSFTSLTSSHDALKVNLQTAINQQQGAIAQANSLQRSQQVFLATLKLTVGESLSVWQVKLVDALGDIQRRFPDLEPRIAKISEEFQDKLNFFQSELGKVGTTGELAATADQLISLLHAVYDHFSSVKVKMVKALDTRNLRLVEAENDELEAALQRYRDRQLVPRSDLEVLTKNYEARLKEFQVNLQTHSQQTLKIASELENEVLGQDPAFLKLRMLVQQQAEQIASLQAQVAAAKQVKLFDSVGWKSELANQVLHHFLAQEIVCDACPMPIREIGNDVEFYITPRTHLGMSLVQSDLDKAAESLKIPLGVKSVKIAIEGKNLKLRVPVSDRDLEKAKPEDVLARPASQWSLYVGSEYHLVIFAATQSGKTSLADELNAMLHTRLHGEIEFQAITLKNDGNRDEEKASRFVKPRFMRSHEEYRESLDDIHAAIENRNQLLQVNPNRRFPRSIFQLDEYGEYYRLGDEVDRKAGRAAVISLFQTGAGLSSETGKGIGLTLIAQNPLVSQNGLNRPDLANACIVIVGDKNIGLFLSTDRDNHGLDEDDLDRLKHELKIFKAASRVASQKALEEAEVKGEDGAIAVRKCPENYYSLVIPSKAGLPPIILYNPLPGEFTNVLTQPQIELEAEVKKPTCPDCNGTEVKQRGQSDRYYCQNTACARQTFTWKG